MSTLKKDITDDLKSIVILLKGPSTLTKANAEDWLRNVNTSVIILLNIRYKLNQWMKEGKK